MHLYIKFASNSAEIGAEMENRIIYRMNGQSHNGIAHFQKKRKTDMRIDFHEIKEITIPGMNGGTGMMSAKMFIDEQGKIISATIHSGGSIGLHKHETSDDINYVISGKGKAVCDGKEEMLSAGICHICKKGSEHSITNTGSDDLVLLTVVVER